MSAGYDISASLSSAAATGAQSTGSKTYNILGGSNGVPAWLLYVAAGVIAWLIFFRKKK